MTRTGNALWLGALTLLAVPSQPLISRAALYHYRFLGEVTSLENPSGYLTDSATVGAPVSGVLSYTDTPLDGSEEFSPFVTFYLHDRSISAVTEFVLRVGDVEARSSDFSLTNMAIGNDNTDPLPPFFPEGDFFRYVDELDSGSSLFDFSGAELEQFSFGNIFLTDSTASAFSSQGLPHGLPLGAFDQQHGNIQISDENSEMTGLLEFRIDSIQAIPEPGAVVLFLVSSLTLLSVAAMHARKVRALGRG